MLLALYETKDALRHAIGQPLHFQETQLLFSEYRPTGVVAVCGQPGADGRRWTAEVTLVDGHVVCVE
jgi:hypothetical protein